MEWWTQNRWYPYSTPEFRHPSWLCARCGASANGILYNFSTSVYEKSCEACAQMRMLDNVVND